MGVGVGVLKAVLNSIVIDEIVAVCGLALVGHLTAANIADGRR